MFKLRIGNEGYSPKSGMKVHWYTVEKEFISDKEVMDHLETDYPDEQIDFDKGSTSKGTIYRFVNGTPRHVKFKIMKTTKKD